MKRITAFILTASICLLFSSCALTDGVKSLLGFDTYDYEGEAVIGTVLSDSEEEQALEEMLRMLTVNSPYMPEFDSGAEAVEECRDAMLNYLLCTGFSMYTGNPTLLEEAETKYPELRIITVIPSEDFENFVYTHFGGNSKLTHESSELFTYLEAIFAYTAISVPVENNVSFEFITCEKTEKTYRFTFRASLGDTVSPMYKSLVVKREDGSMYFKYVEQIERAE